MCPCESVYFRRDGQEWVEPSMVVRLDNSVVEFLHYGRVQTADLQKVSHACTSSPCEDEVLDTYEEAENIHDNSADKKKNVAKVLPPGTQEEDDRRLTHKQSEFDRVSNTASSSKHFPARRTKAEILAERRRAIVRYLPEKKAFHAPFQMDMITMKNIPPFNKSNSLPVEKKSCCIRKRKELLGTKSSICPYFKH